MHDLANLEGILGRYSLGGKHLIHPGPTPDEIDAIAQAALRAPDHGELTPFRFCIISGESRTRLADLFETYARAHGKSDESCQIERARALGVPLTIAVIAKIDMNHPLTPAHEQWICIGGAVINILNAIHLLGYAGKMLSGGKVRDPQIIQAFCQSGEILVGWIVAGTASAKLRIKRHKTTEHMVSIF